MEATSVNISLSKSELTDLIATLVDKIKIKKTEKEVLEREIRDLNARVIQFKKALSETESGVVIKPPTNNDNYSENWSWLNKIKFALSLAKRSLTTNEIYESLCEFEPHLLAEKRKVISSISGTLSIKSGSYEDKKDLIKHKNKNGEFEYEIWEENSKMVLTNEHSIKLGDVIMDDLPF